MSSATKSHTVVTKEIAKNLGFKEAEWSELLEGLGREPTDSEFSFYFMLWSEVLSQKSTISLRNPGIPYQIGESLYSGVTEVNDELVMGQSVGECNFLSGISPREGAEMALARSLEALFSHGLRAHGFSVWMSPGEIQNTESCKRLLTWNDSLSRASNLLGIPLLSQRIHFSKNTVKNPILNISTFSLSNKSQHFTSKNVGPGDQIVYVGLPTGGEGLNLNPEEQSIPQLPVGDLFYQNKLFDAIEEAMEKGLVSEMKQVTAGGLASAIGLLAYKVQNGLQIELASIPKTIEDLGAKETLLSDTPHRVLLVVKKDKHRDLTDVFSARGLETHQFGEIENSDDIAIFSNYKELGNLPYRHLIERCHIVDYNLIDSPPMPKTTALDVETRNAAYEKPNYFEDVWVDVLATPEVASKKLFLSDFDLETGANSVFSSDSSASILRIPGKGDRPENKGVALAVECLPESVSKDAYNGTTRALALALGKVAATGARPVAVSFCLNSGDFNNFEKISSFHEASKAINDICKVWGLDILNDTISMAPDTIAEPALLAPVVSVVGYIDDLDKCSGGEVKAVGQTLFLLGETRLEMAASAYSKQLSLKSTEEGDLPVVQFEEEKARADSISKLISSGLVSSARYISTGGLASEMVRFLTRGEKNRGGTLEFKDNDLRDDLLLFSESHGRYLISCAKENADELEKKLLENGISIAAKGESGGKEINIVSTDKYTLPVGTTKKIFEGALDYLKTTG